MIFEIGSEFWTACTPLDGNGVGELLPSGMQVHYTLSGRTSLELILRDILLQKDVKKAYLPSYCCHTMIEPFATKGVSVFFYDVRFSAIGIECDFVEDNDCDVVYLMDYFGFLNRKTAQLAEKQRERGKCVIYDATHTIFCKSRDYGCYDYVFGSFRKWFEVNAGFCAKNDIWIDFPLLSQNSEYTDLRNKAFDQKQEYMISKSAEKKVFLGAFSQAEKQLETDYIGYGPDAISVHVLETVNVPFIRSKRRENAMYAIEAINVVRSKHVVSPYKKVKDFECPLFVPLIVDASVRDGLRQTLIDNHVYLPVHWPLSPLHQANILSRQMYDTELSFVCDQRYGVADMQRAIHIIRSFCNG